MGAEQQLAYSPSAEAMAGTPISYEIERQLRLDFGLIEVGKFRWPSPVEHVVKAEEDCFSFNLALSPRPSQVTISDLAEPARISTEGLGRIMLLNPGCTFQLSIPAGQVRSLYCGIKRRMLEEIVDGPAHLDERKWFMRLETRAPVIELLLNRIYEELCDEEFGSKLAIESYAQALCVELARCLRVEKADEPRFRKGGLAPWRLQLIEQRVQADAPAPRLSELAQLCGMTVRQLTRAFKAETGKTLGKFISESTMERASWLLSQTSRPISEIAAGLGFANSASFAYAFRRSKGIAPSEARRRRLD